MASPKLRELSPSQHDALEAVDRFDPGARVVGWLPIVRGPLIQGSNGQRFSFSRYGTRREAHEFQ